MYDLMWGVGGRMSQRIMVCWGKRSSGLALLRRMSLARALTQTVLFQLALGLYPVKTIVIYYGREIIFFGLGLWSLIE